MQAQNTTMQTKRKKKKEKEIMNTYILKTESKKEMKT